MSLLLRGLLGAILLTTISVEAHSRYNMSCTGYDVINLEIFGNLSQNKDALTKDLVINLADQVYFVDKSQVVVSTSVLGASNVLSLQAYKEDGSQILNLQVHNERGELDLDYKGVRLDKAFALCEGPWIGENN